MKLANEIVYVDELKDYTVNRTEVGKYHVAKMQKRNRYMVDNSSIVIAVYNGGKGGTFNCLSYAHKEGRTIYYIIPKHDFKVEVKYGWF